MNNIKLQRYESIILNTINRTIVIEVNDKSAKHGRVTYVKLTNDLSQVNAYVECLDHSKMEMTLNALNKLSGLFRSKIAQQLNTYKTPRIIFKEDKTIDYAKNIDKILSKIKEEK